MERVSTAMSESSSIHSDRFHSLAKEFSEMGLDSRHRRLEDPTFYPEQRAEMVSCPFYPQGWGGDI